MSEKEMSKREMFGGVKPMAGLCVDFTNIGTNNPKILNSCGDFVTAKISNWDKEGRLVATRFFHLNPDMERSLAFPGYQMVVSSIAEDFKQTSGDDGSRFLSLTRHSDRGFAWWTATNHSGDRFNATSFMARRDGQQFEVIYTIEPATSVDIWGWHEDMNPQLYLNWAELDPY
ncbi:MAG: hypothetical protein EOR77_21505 [Mesorhizobium sp.]|uniref:hypothetical protein n=1 Tax=Mesorhizobium sp. TaxID=1871066 RepID=UPI000FE8FFF4|nr:hypothetical protein [Mesorhizobium sp.]RWM32609.1 MAG: hypothetical protein EOR77_21505 [Mesorhizobium sp.]